MNHVDISIGALPGIIDHGMFSVRHSKPLRTDAFAFTQKSFGQRAKKLRPHPVNGVITIAVTPQRAWRSAEHLGGPFITARIAIQQLMDVTADAQKSFLPD